LLVSYFLFLFNFIYCSNFGEESRIKTVILNFGVTIKKKNVNELKNYFYGDAIFKYMAKQISYKKAIDNLIKKIIDNSLSGSLYIGEIKSIKNKLATATYIAWFEVNGKIYEGSGIMILIQNKSNIWEIKEMSSHLEVFDKIFFNQ